MLPKTIRARLLFPFSVLGALLALQACSINQVGLGAQVDLTAPKVAITAPSADGTYARGTVTLSGTVNEDVSLKSLAVVYSTPTGDKQKAIPVNNFVAKQPVAWTVSLTSGPGGDLSDGSNTLTIVATDNSDKVMTQTRLVYIDNIEPTVLIQSPSSYDSVLSKAPVYTDYIDVKGEVYDASPVSRVQVSVYRADKTLLKTVTADGTNTFSARFLLKTDLHLTSSDETGGFLYVAQATDASGNVSSSTFHRQDIYTAMTKSGVAAGTVFPTVDEIGKTYNAGSGTSATGIAYDQLKAVIHGASPASALFGYQFGFQYTSAPIIQFVNVDPASTKNILGVNAVLTATIQPPPTPGMAIDPSSVTSQIYSMADTSTPLFTLTGPQDTQALRSVGDSYSYALTLKNGTNSLLPGNYRLKLAAQATGSSVAHVVVDFSIDSGAPYIDKATTSNLSSYVKAPITLAGQASAEVDLAKIDIYQWRNGVAFPDANPIKTIPLSGKDAAWASDPLPTGGGDGTYDYTVTLTTSTSKVTSVFHTMTYDTTAPTVTVNAVSPLVGTGAITGSSNTFSFGASDTNGVTEVRWWLLDAAAAAPAWTTAGSSSLTVPPYTVAGFDTSTVPEGAKKLWVIGRDKAGNEGSASQALQVDYAPPSLTETGPTGNGAVVKAAPVYSGTAADSNGLAGLTAAVDGGAASAVPVSSGTWTYTYAVDAGTHAQDGSHTLVFTATDLAGRTTTLTRSLQVDTTAPTVSVNSVAPLVGTGALTGASNTFSFGASDANGVSEVRWWLLDSSASQPAWTTPGAGSLTAAPYQVTGFDATAVAEGRKKLWVLAHDPAGNEGAASQAFQVDHAPPTLTETSSPPGAPAQVKAAVTYGGAASDTNPSGPVTLTVAVDGAAAAAVPVTAGTWTYTYAVNASTHAEDGLHSLVFTATDGAGRSTVLTKTLQVDTQAPGIGVAAPTSASWSSSSTLSALGTATDGASGTGVAALYLKVDNQYVASGPTDHSAEDPVASGWTVATGTGSWFASLSIGAEGRKTLWIKAVDAVGNVTTAAAAVAGRIDFGLDLLPPVLGFTDSVGTLVNGAYTFTGTASDSNPAAPATITVSADGGAAAGLTVSAGAWSDPVSLPADGSHTYVFTVTDVAGKTTTLSRTLTVDTTKPTLSISQPAALASSNPSYWLSGATAAFSGSAADLGAGASGVAQVRFLIAAKGADHSSDNPVSGPGWGPAGGATSWTTTADLTALGEGEFTLWTAAVDNAGNVGTIVHRDFGVDQAVPTLSETSRSATSSAKTSFSLTGQLGDSNALASLVITETSGSVKAVTVTPASVSGKGPTAWTAASLPVGGVADGSYLYTIKATDVAGKTTTVLRTVTIDTTAPTLALNPVPTWLTSAAYTVSGTAADPNAGASGVALIEYQLDGGAWTAAAWADTSGGGNTAGTWSSTLTGLAEGNHTIKARATDAAGNQTTLGVTNFGVDLAAPGLTETLLGSPTQATVNSGFTLTGAVTDSNPASVAGTTLTVSVSVNGGAATAAGVTGSTWTFNQAKVDGTYSYQITATDAAGRTTTVNRLVLLDSTAPTVSVTAPAAGAWQSSATASAAGASLDGAGSGVLKTYVLVDDAGQNHTADITAWNGTSGASAPVSGTSASWASASGLPASWTASAALSGEGYKRLWVVAVDKAGNMTTPTSQAATAVTAGNTYVITATGGSPNFTAAGAPNNAVGTSFTATGTTTGTGTVVLLPGVVFGYDTAPPTLAETAVNTASTVIRNASVTFSGTVGDSNALASAHALTLSVDGGAAADVTVAAGSWTSSYAVNGVSHAQDGTHTFAFTATDAAGKTTSVVRSVLVDTTVPSASAVTPAATVWLGTSPVSATGTAADGAGSGVAQVWTLVDAAGNDHSADTPAAITAGTTWKLASGTTGWSYSWALGAEGAKSLWTAVKDAAGNWSTPAVAQNFGYDLAPPALAETAVNTTATIVRNASVTFTGTASDSNALDAAHPLTLSIDGAAASDLVLTAGAWTTSFPVNAVTHAQDGTHTFTFTATDAAGKTTTVNRTVLVDTTPATASVTAPAAGAWTNATPYSVTGLAGDSAGSGVQEVWSLVDLQANNHAADSAAAITTGGNWKKASGTSNWSYSWALGAEGNKSLWVAVLDAAGNWSTPVAARNFGYDATAPALAITPLGGFNAAFTVTGTTSDAGSGLSTLQLKIDSGTLNAVTVAANWSYTVPAAVFSALGEGTHQVTVIATDAAGNQTIQSTTFNKDTTAPTLAYSNISSGGGSILQDSSPALNGTLSDVSGVNGATYTLEVWNANTSAWNAIATGASLGTPGGATSYNWTLVLGSAGLNLPDGSYRIAVGASDAPGNAIASPVPVTFSLSRTSPSAAVTAPALGTFQNGPFPMVGTTADPSGVTAVKVKLASGSVDFGSGTTSAYPASPVTVALGTPGVFGTTAAHGLAAGDVVYFWGTPMPTSSGGLLTAGAAYYVKTTPTSTTFTVAATSGGPALAVTTSTATNLIVAAQKDSFASYRRAVPVSSVSGTTLTAANHNLAAGDVVYLGGTTLPAPATKASAYYVVNPTAATFQLSLTSGGAAVTFTTAGSAVTAWSPTQTVWWMVPSLAISGQSDGALTAYAQTTAASGKTGQTSRDLTLDTAGPTVSINSPSGGTRQVGNLTITGTSSDPGAIPSGVTGTIQYQVGNGYNLGNASSWTSANVSGGSYSWAITLGDMSGYANATYATQCDSSGNAATGTNLWKLPIVFQATDRAGNAGQLTTYWLILDPNGNIPVMAITQPATGLTFGGQQRITGTASQPTWIHDVEIAVDPTGGNNFPANPVSAALSGNTVTAAAHPFLAGQMVFLTGTAAPQIGGVNVAATTPFWVVNPTANTFQLAAASGGSAVTFSSSGTGVTASVWAPATLTTTGNNIVWYYDINTSLAYPQGGATSQTVSIQARGWNSPTAGGSRGTLSGTLTAPLSMTFNSTFPKIQSVLVNGQSYFAQITTRGTVSLTASVSSSKGIAKVEAVESSPLSGSTAMYDTAGQYTATAAGRGAYWSSTVTPPASKTSDSFASGNTVKVMITATGSNAALWTAAGAPATTPGTVFTPNNTSLSVGAASGSFIESDASGNFQYSVTMSIDSTQLYNATTGQYAFDLRATDLGSPAQVSTSPVVLNEDNYYPLASLSTPAAVSAGSFQIGGRYVITTLGTTDFTAVGATSNTVGLSFVATGAGTGTGTVLAVLTGTAFKITGSSTDVGAGSGSIGGLSKVIVYLTNTAGTQLLDLKTGGAAAAASSLTAKDMTNAGAVGTVPYPSTGSYSAYFASIDTLSEVGLTDTNGDGLLESFTQNGSSRDWWAQIDTTKLADGPVAIHYVVWDAAGNATHYAQAAFVSNNSPGLASIDIGTDLNGDGTISAGEITNFPAASNFAATGFSVRNSMLSMKINIVRGTNAPLYYSVKYNGSEQNGTLTNNTVTISNFGTIPDSASASAYDRVFTVNVYDSTAGTTPGTTSQFFTQTVALNVQNKDNTPPTVALAPLGTVYSAAASDASKVLTTAAYSQNIGGGGGHLEYSGQTASPVAATTAVNGNAYLIWTNGTGGGFTDFTTLTASSLTTPAANLTAGLWYWVQTVGSTDFTTVGAATASPAPGTLFQATKAGGGTGTVIAVGTSFVDNGTTATGTGQVIPLSLAATPAVSGQLVFRGKAYDNQRISRLTAQISTFNGGAGSGSEFDIATWNGTGLTAAANNGNWSWALDTADSVSQTNGHVLNWALTWDSSKISSIAQAGITVTIRAYDFWTTGTGATTTATSITSTALSGMTIPSGTPIWIGSTAGTWSSGTWTTTSAAYAGSGALSVAATTAGSGKAFVLSNPAGASATTVDVVPYVTAVTTRLSAAYPSKPSVIQRSALGAYPVAEGETGVTLTGYNLSGSTTAVTMNGTAATMTGGTAPSSAVLTVPTAASATVSGAMTVKVNSVASANNTNNNKMPWNSAANAVNNNLLTDDLNFSLWKINSLLTDTTIRYPVMKIAKSSSSASQYMGWSYDQAENYFFMSPSKTNNAAAKFEGNPTRYYDTAFAFDEQGDSFGEANSGDITASGSSITDWSGVAVFWSAAGTMSTALNGGYSVGTYKSMFSSVSSDKTVANTNSNRIQNPSMASALATPGSALGTGNLATMYLAYYDAVLNTVVLRTGTTTGASAASNVTGALANRTGSTATPMDTAGAITIAGTTTSGQYSSIALDPVGRTTLAAAWYDATNKRLMYSYNTAPTTAGQAAQWSTNAVAVDSSLAGWYAAMAIDAGGGVHIAYYRTSTGDLCYAYSPSITSPSFTKVTVDSYLSVGQNISIDTWYNGSAYVPYISYYSSTFDSTSASVKVAYRADLTTLRDGSTNDQFTGGWEVQTLPLASNPKNYKVSLGFKDFIGTGSSLTPTMGYATSTGIEYTYLK